MASAQTIADSFLANNLLVRQSDGAETRVFMENGKLKISEDGADATELHVPVVLRHQLFVSTIGQSAADGATGSVVRPFATIQQAIDYASNVDPDPKYQSGFASGEGVVIHVGPGTFPGFSLKRRQTFIRGASENAADLVTKISGTVTIDPSTLDANSRFNDVYGLSGVLITPPGALPGVVATGSVSGTNGHGVYTLNIDNCYIYTGDANGTTHHALVCDNANAARVRIAVNHSIINVASGAAQAAKLDAGDVRIFFSTVYMKNDGATPVSAITLAGSASLWMSTTLVDVTAKLPAISARGSLDGSKLIITDSGITNRAAVAGAHGIDMENTSSSPTKLAALLNNILFTVTTTGNTTANPEVTAAVSGVAGSPYVYGNLQFAPGMNSVMSGVLVAVPLNTVIGALTCEGSTRCNGALTVFGELHARGSARVYNAFAIEKYEGSTPPAVANADEVKFYFDGSRIKVSQSGSLYQNLVGPNSIQSTLVTTDDTTTTLITIPTATNSAGIMEVKVAGRDAATGNMQTVIMAVRYKNAAGVTSATASNLFDHADVSGMSFPIAVASGSNVLIQVTGEAGVSWSWSGTATVESVV